MCVLDGGQWRYLQYYIKRRSEPERCVEELKKSQIEKNRITNNKEKKKK
jgi:hypothetical protein